MRKLKEMGVIEELHFNQTHHHYELKPRLKHQHLVCLNCGKVMEYEYDLGTQIKRRILQERGFEVTGTEIQIAGYCDQCRKLRQNV
jgi:Fur family ferric uptake transcriptional regulator